MPSTDEHLALAEKNLGLYEKLLSDPEVHPGWALTVLFYVAVHLARAVGRSHGYGPYTSHHGFDSELRTQLKAPDHIYKAYKTLKDQSEHARYDVCTLTKDDVLHLKNTKFSLFSTWARNQIRKEPLD
jgi:hypothetical protein